MDTKEKQRYIQAFEKIPTANISDAMDQLHLPSGVMVGLQPLNANQPSAAGFALTIQQADKGRNTTEKGKVQQRMVINTMTEPGDFLVIDACGRLDVSTGGALLALRAKIRGVNGFLVHGCLRDCAEISKMDFPVYYMGRSPASSGNGLETVSINQSVTIGGVRIHPGDLIVMDDTGCLVVPQEHMEEVLKIAQVIQKREKRTEELLHTGMDFVEAKQTGIAENPFTGE